GVYCGAAADDQGRPQGSMGVDAGDYNGTGKPSLWVTNYEGELHALYENHSTPGKLFFSFATYNAGLAVLGQKFVGWGTRFVDFDLDGWEDLFVTNGHAIRYPKGKGVTRKQRPVLLCNEKGKFTDISRQMGPYGEKRHLGRGVAFGDLDN